MVTDWEPDPDDPKDINVSQEDEGISISKVNTIFETLGLTPIKLCEINRSKNCLYTKLKELQDAVLLGLGIQEEIDSENESDKSINSILNNIKEECPLKSVTRQLAEELHPSERHLLPILQPIIDVLFLSPILLLLASLFCLCKKIEEGVCRVNLKICFLLNSFKAT